ncbi:MULTISPECIES: lysophospholipid acyltransferase family protein [Ralstonia]|jgi:KDO2-lipid IV(A) lauroyltransferase|uniref:Lipid A biosynthesis lauroyltransferase n=1 Tax=Ralstonia flaminis TaxID=3058597 RepID=A0ABM9K4S6_9RALS|nr:MULTISPECIES: lysophospholipid acyltransferase family protein [unclassified Ralstonia]CAJ0813708.1 Lipid A biosynthesis lauroyltransferase [Ralstonia sp. LMG 18101]
MHRPSQLAQRALPTLLRLFSSLPLPVIHGIGRAFGRIVYAIPGGYRRHVQRNAAQAGFKEPRFARQAAAETGAMMSELARVWFQSEACMTQVICEDWDVIEQALAERNGLIMLTPHLGCFELAARYAAQRIPLTIMFRPHRKAMLRGLLDAVRATSNLKTVPATAQGVRSFVRALRQGDAVGLLPDQAPKGDGVWVPFFGRLAYTMTLPGKLAQQTNAALIVAAGERLPGGRGWRMHVKRLTGPLPQSAEAQAAWINAEMEEMVRRFPQQYLWGYNRYKVPAGAPAAPTGTA